METYHSSHIIYHLPHKKMYKEQFKYSGKWVIA